MKKTFERFRRALIDHYADFDGRAHVGEFWGYIAICAALWVLTYMAFAGFGVVALSSLLAILFFALVVPTAAISVRRLHDTDRSGYWLLLAFVPFVGWFLLIYWSLQHGTRGANRYGEPRRLRWSDMPNVLV